MRTVRRHTAGVWLLAAVLLALGGCSDHPRAGVRSDPRQTVGTPSTASTTSDGNGTSTPSRLTAAAVIARARRPLSGAVSGPRVLLIYATGHAAAFVLHTPTGVTQSLLRGGRESWEFTRITPYRKSFVLIPGGSLGALRLSARGVISRVDFSRTPTRPAPGDLLVAPSMPTFRGRDGHGSFGPAWLFRPATRTVLTRPVVPSGAHLTHMDGHGTLWALAKPRRGHAVLLSAAPGEAWVSHDVGAFSRTSWGCACDTVPGPHGRGGVLVLAGNPLQHVSTDYGATWRTFDLDASVPYRRVLGAERFPQVSALADGRLVIGYFDYWLADDPSNTSFTKLDDPRRALWRSGLEDSLLFRGKQVSADGGRTWVTFRP